MKNITATFSNLILMFLLLTTSKLITHIFNHPENSEKNVLLEILENSQGNVCRKAGLSKNDLHWVFQKFQKNLSSETKKL